MSVNPEATMNPLFRVIAIVLPILMIATCGLQVMPTPKEKKGGKSVLKEREWMVETVPVKLVSAAPEVVLFGSVRAQDSARLSGTVAGEVLKVHIKPGDKVQKGAPLVELDDLDLQSVLAQRQADVADVESQIALENSRHAADKQSLRHEQQLLRIAEKAVKRNNNLRRRQAISDAVVEQAQEAKERQALAVSARKAQVEQHPARLNQLTARLARAKTALRVAQRDLGDTQVVAPFSGSVTQVMVSPGDEIRPGGMMVELFNRDSLELVAQIPGRYLKTVKQALENSTPMLALSKVDNVPVRAKLTRLSNASELGGVQGYFTITSGQTALETGRRVRFVFELPPKNGVVIAPFSALYGLNRVYLREGHRLKRIAVTLEGEVTKDGTTQAMLLSPDLKDGQTLVLTQLPNALEGLKVTTAAEQQEKRAKDAAEAKKAEQAAAETTSEEE